MHKSVYGARMGTGRHAQPLVIPKFTSGDRLRKARELTGMDQETFAELLGVSRGTVSNYERSRTMRRHAIVLRAWAMATGVPLYWLEGGGVGEPPHRRVPPPVSA